MRFQASDFASSEYTICIPNETVCAVVSHPKPNSVLVSWIHSVHWICGDLLCQHFLAKRVGFLPCSLTSGVFPSRPIWHLDRMHPACSTNHGRTGESSLSGSCVLLSIWHLMVLMIPRSSITSFTMSPFGSVSPFDLCFAHCSYTISERDYCTLCVALQRDFAITEQVNEFHRSLDCPRLLNSLLQRHTAHDVPASVLFHRDARYRFF